MLGGSLILLYLTSGLGVFEKKLKSKIRQFWGFRKVSRGSDFLKKFKELTGFLKKPAKDQRLG